MYSAVKCQITTPLGYRGRMARLHKNDTRRTVATNLRALLDLREWSEHDLAKKSGVAQKTINNILNMRTAATIETAQSLATPFGLTNWHLLIPLACLSSY